MAALTFVRFEGKYIKIALQEIAYIEARKNYSRVVYTGKESHVVLIPLKAWLEILPGDQFVVAHRSFIVALGKIASFDSKTIYLEGGKTVPWGTGYRGKLLRKVHICEPEQKGRPRRFQQVQDREM